METLKEFVKSFIYDPNEQQPLLPTSSTVTSFPPLPQRLTHQLYLDVRRKNDTPVKYLDFIQKTYYQHFKDSFSRSLICTKAAFYFFIQSFFPNAFQHHACDLIINLSDTILDEYALIFETQARDQTRDPTRDPILNCTRKVYERQYLKK